MQAHMWCESLSYGGMFCSQITMKAILVILAVFTLPIVFSDCHYNAFNSICAITGTYRQLEHLRMYNWNKKRKIFELNPKFVL
jgi:hypothetical protein